ncbi:MAG TPA: hypothetical protein VM263_01665, partial [Acidimicrobiales bacterium]|nr:hypothetical protein [Acidimicrobiales bacterium]
MTTPAAVAGAGGDGREPAAGAGGPGPAPRRGDRPRASTWAAMRGLLLRDLTVLDKSLGEFLHNTVTQPLLLVFVFTW